MADVTISQLSIGSPDKITAVIPYSDGASTLKTSPSGIVAASPGCLLQVQQAVRTSTFLHNYGQVWKDVSPLSAVMIPSSINSKFLINWSGSVSVQYAYGTGTQVSAYKIVRTINGVDSDTILGDTRGSGVRASSCTYAVGNHVASTFTGMYLDSPNTLSPVTYRFQMWAENSAVYNSLLGGSFNTNQTYDTNVPTYLTVQEIAG